MRVEPQPDPPIAELRARIAELDLDLYTVWLRYFAVGGQALLLELEAYVYEALLPSSLDHMCLTQAVWEFEHFEA